MPSYWLRSIRYEPYLFVDAARLSTVADSRSHALASAGGGLRIAFAGGFAELIDPFHRAAIVAPPRCRSRLAAGIKKAPDLPALWEMHLEMLFMNVDRSLAPQWLANRSADILEFRPER